MSVLFNRECEYAIQAMMYLAQKPRGELSTIKQIAGKIKVPYHFLAKIFQKLTRKGLLRSVKGVSGGFSLARPAEKIVLLDIIQAIDGDDFMKSCVLGFPVCSDENPCPLHSQWKIYKTQLQDSLSEKHIGELVIGLRKSGFSAA
jgi:Rrf2 family transcriptional regulator, iron-sulfur cluster assembly transcription factor